MNLEYLIQICAADSGDRPKAAAIDRLIFAENLSLYTDITGEQADLFCDAPSEYRPVAQYKYRNVTVPYIADASVWSLLPCEPS